MSFCSGGTIGVRRSLHIVCPGAREQRIWKKPSGHLAPAPHLAEWRDPDCQSASVFALGAKIDSTSQRPALRLEFFDDPRGRPWLLLDIIALGYLLIRVDVLVTGSLQPAFGRSSLVAEFKVHWRFLSCRCVKAGAVFREDVPAS